MYFNTVRYKTYTEMQSEGGSYRIEDSVERGWFQLPEGAQRVVKETSTVPQPSQQSPFCPSVRPSRGRGEAMCTALEQAKHLLGGDTGVEIQLKSGVKGCFVKEGVFSLQ